jgi:hypothetical protein
MNIPHWAVLNTKVVSIHDKQWFRFDTRKLIEDGPVFMQIYTIKKAYMEGNNPVVLLKEINPEYEVHLYDRNGRLSFQPVISLEDYQSLEIERTIFHEKGKELEKS